MKAKKPLLPAKPAHLQLPGREAREKSPVPEKLPKPRAPTPEPADGAYDEGYCTVRHPVRLLQEVRVLEFECTAWVGGWVGGCLVD